MFINVEKVAVVVKKVESVVIVVKVSWMYFP